MSSNSPYFSVHLKPRPNATKVLFYFTSYKLPWWIFIVPILRFHFLGYEVVTYDFHDEILENDDVRILPRVVMDIINDVAARRAAYEKHGVKTFHGIGNSLGSYMMFNCSIRIPFSAIVLNSAGSAADALFNANNPHLKKTTGSYEIQGYSRETLHQLWREFDSPSNGGVIKAPKILITYSWKDKLLPPSGPIELIRALEMHDRKYKTKTDHLPHAVSVFLNSLRVQSLYQFLNN